MVKLFSLAGSSRVRLNGMSIQSFYMISDAEGLQEEAKTSSDTQGSEFFCEFWHRIEGGQQVKPSTFPHYVLHATRRQHFKFLETGHS